METYREEEEERRGSLGGEMGQVDRSPWGEDGRREHEERKNIDGLAPFGWRERKNVAAPMKR